MKPLISVIVPIYKVEKYLSKCIESIINQTYKNLEVWLIDDGSPDSCGDICDQYAKQDYRIKVIHKKNGGLSDARNAALDVFTGEYVTYVDSDDYISDDYVEYLYHLLIHQKADVSMLQPLSFMEDTPLQKNILKEKLRICSGKEALEIILYQRDCDISAWGKLYKRNFFETLRYPKGKIFEDLGTTYKILLECNKCVISSQKKYYYLIREDSIDNKKFNIQKMDLLEMMDNLSQTILFQKPELKKAVQCRELSVNFHLFLQIEPGEFEKQCSLVWDNIRKLRWKVIFDIHARKKTRIAGIISILGKRVLWFIGNKVN